MADAKSMVAEFSKGLPMTRDLTDAKETMRVLEIASEIIKSGHPIQQFKDACFGDAEPQLPIIRMAHAPFYVSPLL